MINNIGTIIGLIFAFVVIVLGVMQKTTDVSIFINIPSLEIVGGGLVAAIMISYGFRGIFLFFSGFFSALFSKHYNVSTLGNRLIAYSKIVRENGFAYLENEQDKIDDKIEKEILELIAAGYSKEDVLAILDDKIYALLKKHEDRENLFTMLFRYAPAFGMFGTIIGIVLMLINLSTNPDQIGPSLAIALVTTFYGLILAYFMFGPISEKLEILKKESLIYYTILREGLKFVMEKRNEIFIRDFITSYISEKMENK